jgi:peptide methionine sulfoxide reductase MsrA
MSAVAPAYGSKPISTTLELFTGFYEAEEYHQDYLTKNVRGYECSTHFERTWEKIASLYGGKVPNIENIVTPAAQKVIVA